MQISRINNALGEKKFIAGYSEGVFRIKLSNGEIWEVDCNSFLEGFEAFLTAYENRQIREV